MELFLTVVRKIGIAVLIVDNGVVLFALLPAEIILISAGSFFVPCGVDVVCSAAHLSPLLLFYASLLVVFQVLHSRQQR